MLVESCAAFAHSTSGCKHSRYKRRVLCIADSLLVASSLLLMPLVAFGDWSAPVCTSIRIENPYINKGALQTATPDSIRCDIKAGLLLGYGRPVAKHLSCDGLEMWLDAHIGADTLQQAGSDIADLIMPYRGETPGWA